MRVFECVQAGKVEGGGRLVLDNDDSIAPHNMLLVKGLVSIILQCCRDCMDGGSVEEGRKEEWDLSITPTMTFQESPRRYRVQT